MYNNLLLSQLPDLRMLYAVNYSATDAEPARSKGRLWRWTVSRSASLGMVFTRIRSRRIRIPRLESCAGFLAEIWCETAEYDGQQRTIRFTHPEEQNDDTLHALNYAVLQARRLQDMTMVYGND